MPRLSSSFGSRSLRSRSGFSIAETLVGMALVSVASLSVAYLSNTFSRTLQSPSKDKANCVHQVNSVFSALRAAGQFEGSGSSLAPTSIGGAASMTITGRDLYPNSATVPSFINRDTFYSANANVPMFEFTPATSGNSSLPRLSTGSALRGNIRLIEHLYNLRSMGTGIDFCGRDNAMTPELQAIIDNASAPLRRGGRKFKTSFRIRPYDQLTGEILRHATNPTSLYCPAPLSTFPISMNMQESAFEAVAGRGRMAVPRNEDRLANARASSMGRPRYIGYQVDITTKVTEGRSEEVISSCSGTSRFEYQMLEKEPEAPKIVAVVENSTIRGGVGADASSSNRLAPGDSHVNVVRVLISHRAQGASLVNPSAPQNQRLPPGSILLCRDRSRVPTSANFWASRAACYGGANGPGPQKRPNTASAPERNNLIHLGDSQPVSPMSSRGNAFRVIASAASTADASWQPCENVPLCGVRPEPETVAKDVAASYTDFRDDDNRPTKGNLAIRNVYRNLRADCVPVIEVRVVSASGQVSADVADIRVRSGGNHTFTRRDDIANEVARRECGEWCPLTGQRTFTVPYAGVGGEPASSRTYTIDNDGYELSPGVPRRMYGFAPPPLNTTGAEGYWQVGGCCVSPLPPDSVAAGGAAAIQAFNNANSCRPGRRYRSAGTAANPLRAPSGTAVRETDVAFSDDSKARPQIADLDDLNYAHPSMIAWDAAPANPKYQYTADLTLPIEGGGGGGCESATGIAGLCCRFRMFCP